MPRREEKLDPDLLVARQRLMEQLRDPRLIAIEGETDDRQEHADPADEGPPPIP
jgi:hypothetical protein